MYRIARLKRARIAVQRGDRKDFGLSTLVDLLFAMEPLLDEIKKAPETGLGSTALWCRNVLQGCSSLDS